MEPHTKDPIQNGKESSAVTDLVPHDKQADKPKGSTSSLAITAKKIQCPPNSPATTHEQQPQAATSGQAIASSTHGDKATNLTSIVEALTLLASDHQRGATNLSGPWGLHQRRASSLSSSDCNPGTVPILTVDQCPDCSGSGPILPDHCHPCCSTAQRCPAEMPRRCLKMPKDA